MNMRTPILITLLLISVVVLLSCNREADPRLAGSSRDKATNGWIKVRLQGNPTQIGFQHGYLLADEIADAIDLAKLSLPRDTKRDWAFFRDVAEKILWPHVDQEYKQELAGIAAGLAAHRIKADVWDVVVLNASIELSYFTKMLDKSSTPAAPDRCSAFVATGSWTGDGKIVIAHNNWSGYMEGGRWNIIFDIRPEKGERILMDGYPGFIHSGDDFGMNSAGLVITETTISHFSGFDPDGIPEFVRARKSMQYAKNIDDFARIMGEGNNGGYANTWLVADTTRNEIGRLELGLKNVTLDRTTDGYFVGANFPINPKLIAEETDYPINDPGTSENARRVRFEQLMTNNKGKIDIAAGKAFLSDHFDAFEKKENAPSERTLCGHVELSPRGMKPWQDEFAPAGAVQNKITDTTMAARMELEAAIGHSCGVDFFAAEHLKRYPQYEWQKKFLRDIPSQPWTRFSAEK